MTTNNKNRTNFFSKNKLFLIILLFILTLIISGTIVQASWFGNTKIKASDFQKNYLTRARLVNYVMVSIFLLLLSLVVLKKFVMGGEGSSPDNFQRYAILFGCILVAILIVNHYTTPNEAIWSKPAIQDMRNFAIGDRETGICDSEYQYKHRVTQDCLRGILTPKGIPTMIASTLFIFLLLSYFNEGLALKDLDDKDSKRLKLILAIFFGLMITNYGTNVGVVLVVGGWAIYYVLYQKFVSSMNKNAESDKLKFYQKLVPGMFAFATIQTVLNMFGYSLFSFSPIDRTSFTIMSFFMNLFMGAAVSGFFNYLFTSGGLIEKVAKNDFKLMDKIKDFMAGTFNFKGKKDDLNSIGDSMDALLGLTDDDGGDPKKLVKSSSQIDKFRKSIDTITEKCEVVLHKHNETFRPVLFDKGEKKNKKDIKKLAVKIVEAVSLELNVYKEPKSKSRPINEVLSVLFAEKLPDANDSIRNNLISELMPIFDKNVQNIFKHCYDLVLGRLNTVDSKPKDYKKLDIVKLTILANKYIETISGHLAGMVPMGFGNYAKQVHGLIVNIISYNALITALENYEDSSEFISKFTELVNSTEFKFFGQLSLNPSTISSLQKSIYSLDDWDLLNSGYRDILLNLLHTNLNTNLTAYKKSDGDAIKQLSMPYITICLYHAANHFMKSFHNKNELSKSFIYQLCSEITYAKNSFITDELLKSFSTLLTIHGIKKERIDALFDTIKSEGNTNTGYDDAFFSAWGSLSKSEKYSPPNTGGLNAKAFSINFIKNNKEEFMDYLEHYNSSSGDSSDNTSTD